MEEWKKFLAEYKWRIIGVAFGLLLAILMLTVGFWRTLLLFLIVGVCFFIGAMLDEGGRAKLASFFASLFTKKDE